MWLRACSLFVMVCCAQAQSPSVLLDSMAQELDRNFAVLKSKGEPAAYFMGYSVTEQEFSTLSFSLGTATGGQTGRQRFFDVTLRLGTPQLDNYRQVRGDRPQFTSGAALAIDDTPDALKRRMWMETDRAYRAAAERLVKIRTNTQVRVAQEDASADFSKEEPTVSQQPAAHLRPPAPAWTERLRRLSAAFLKHDRILMSAVSLQAQQENKFLVNTEGSRLQHGRGFARITISAQAKAADGMDIESSQSFEAIEAAALPADAVLHAAAESVAKDVLGMLEAPAVEPFVGPAIFSGRAAGVLFHEIFGHRIEGHRQKDDTEGQTFTRMVGTPVLPQFLSVTFDPTRRKLGTVDLNGWYEYDDEGIRARPVTVVEKGVLKSFLMSRSPIEGFAQSNGHGRRQPGREIVSRQSNLIVESANQVPESKLRELLVAELKRQNKPYGMYFREVTGGYTNTGRGGIQAFKVMPVVVYRIYADGRPDELVRGADIVGTPLASFSKILATSDRSEIFNGYCGAESGNVPVSAASPALLVSEIEIEKTQRSQDRPPLLPPPGAEAKR
jgi:TldD protein